MEQTLADRYISRCGRSRVTAFRRRQDARGGGPGVWLREARQAAGLTQEELAQRSGLAVRTISDLERGVSARPYPRSIRVLVQALGLPQAMAEDVIANYRNGRVPAPGGRPGR
jgi:DNA-binding XRE family transcriptional regulator